MNGKSKPFAILVFGAPMSGKTTFSEQFSNFYSAPFLNLASLHEDYKISRKAALALVSQLTKSRQTLIIEGAIDTEKQRAELRKLLLAANYTPILVWIQTDIGTIKQRLRRKYRKLELAKSALNSALARIEAPTETENPLVISGRHTFKTQCKSVLNSLSKRHTS